MSTKSQEVKDRCEEQNEELKELKVGLKGEEEMLGGSNEMLAASSTPTTPKTPMRNDTRAQSCAEILHIV